jgi:predicted transposase/invertase (TIGR01784 family)
MHDHSYKNLFSHPQMVEDLLTGFVPQAWVRELDFGTLEKLNQSYVSDDLRERADDLVWRVKFRDQWLYVYLLLEFQSTVDPFMAVRLLTYVGLLYQDLIKSRQLPDKRQLPPVFPIVLYNGASPWNAAATVGELIQPLPDGLRAYQPEQRYWLIDEGRYADADLAPLQNLVGALIQAENSTAPEQLARVIANLVMWLQAPEQRSLRQAFTEWFNRVLLPGRMPDRKIEPIHDLMEMQAMLAERVKDWTKQWKDEGIAEGIDQGIDQGEAAVLKRLLTKRFGQLPQWALDRLATAPREQLETWAERIFDATTLDQFFE